VDANVLQMIQAMSPKQSSKLLSSETKRESTMLAAAKPQDNADST
jgi:hypothetical protein